MISSQEKKQSNFKVIGAGFGRTGTMSLRIALQKLLKGKCYHMKDVITNPQHMTFWEKTMRKHGGAKGVTDDEWKEFLSDYVAGCDLPISAFYKDLARIYPEAKVILTTRNPSSWYQSCVNTIVKVLHMNKFPTNILLWLRGLSKWHDIIEDIILQDLNTMDWDNEEVVTRHFIERNERVKAAIPSDRLLVFEAKDGWEPLCKFLNLPVPDEPFPHVNDTKEFQHRIIVMKAATYFVTFGLPLMIAASVGYFKYLRKVR